MLCKLDGVKWRNCYQRNVNVTQLFTYALSHTGDNRHRKLANEQSVPQSSWLLSLGCFATEVVSLEVPRH